MSRSSGTKCCVALSLKQRTAPAHVIVQRLTNSFPADRLSRAVTNLGRIIKTQYILRYLTDQDLRRTVQLQLNKGAVVGQIDNFSRDASANRINLLDERPRIGSQPLVAKGNPFLIAVIFQNLDRDLIADVQVAHQSDDGQAGSARCRNPRTTRFHCRHIEINDT